MDLLKDIKRNRHHRPQEPLVSKRIHFSGPYRHQEWSLRDTLMYYITMQPSSAKAYQKLIRSCKYFYSKNPITVIHNLYYHSKKPVAETDNKRVLNFNSNPYKFWLTFRFSTDPSGYNLPNLVSSLIPKFYRFDVKQLRLHGQSISYDQFVFISSKARDIRLSMVTVKNDDGSIVALEKLVEVLPEVKELVFDVTPECIIVSSKTMKKLLKIEHFAKIHNFELFNIPEAFDLKTYYAYFKVNKFTKFQFYFSNSLSVGYRKRLEEIVDEVIEVGLRDFKGKPIPSLLPAIYHRFPYINFRGLSRQKHAKIRNFYRL